MTSSRPYLLRAMYEWMLDNDLTPQIVVDAQGDGVLVPRQFVADGRIVLNVAPSAVRGLRLGNDRVEFSARFGGKPYEVRVPIRSVVAVFSRENGSGMSFPEETDTPEPTPPEPKGSPPGRPQLKVVK